MMAPPMAYMPKITARTTGPGTFRPATHEAMLNGMRVIVKNLPRIMAPAISMMTMQETRRVSMTAFLKFSQESVRWTRLMTTAKKAPAPPASDGVKYPAYSPVMIRKNRISISMAPERERMRSRKLDFGPAGPHSGFKRQTTDTVSSISRHKRRPAPIPP